VHEHQPAVGRLELLHHGGSRVGVELSGEQDVIDDDVGVKVVGQIPDATVEVEIEPVAEAEHGVRRVLVDELEHPAPLVEGPGSVLADVEILR